MSDEVHPNAQGYQAMSALILNAMRPHLQANNLLK
jgi:lysophospholipase L1-like esterase